MSITYNQTTNRIVVSGGDTASPLTFEDILTEDQNNGWNVFSKVADGIYKTDAKIEFINCVFSENNSGLIMENLGTQNYDKIVLFKTDANCEFKSVSFWNYDANYTCGYYLSGNPTVRFTECAFYTAGNRTVFEGTGNSCVFEKCYSELYYMAATVELIDVIIGGEYGFISRPTEDCVFKNVVMDTGYPYCFWLNGGSYIVNGGKYNAVYRLADMKNVSSFKIKNANLLKTGINVYADAGNTTEFTISYDVLFRILDSEGNTISKKVRITDCNGTVFFDDVISEQIIELPLYTYTHTGDGQWHTITEDDYTYHIPYTVEVYDEVKTYYSGYVTTLRICEITINEELPDLSAMLWEIKTIVYRIRNALYRIGIR